MATNAVKVEEAKLLHLRLGHFPVNKLYIVDKKFSTSLSQESVCQIYPQATQTKKSFPVSLSVTDKCFQILHLDDWGHYNVQTHDKCNMFFTIVDDF